MTEVLIRHPLTHRDVNCDSCVSNLAPWLVVDVPGESEKRIMDEVRESERARERASERGRARERESERGGVSTGTHIRARLLTHFLRSRPKIPLTAYTSTHKKTRAWLLTNIHKHIASDMTYLTLCACGRFSLENRIGLV